MAPTYSPWVVLASFFIAALASFVTLGLARRVFLNTGRISHLWWGCGSVVMGTGIWAMHFIGMQAFELPITLGYDGTMTLLSWAAAVLSSAIALWVASRSHNQGLWWLGAFSMGGGVAGMHYLGMHAMHMTIPIVWDLRLVVLSVLVAVLASAAALSMFRAMCRLQGKVLWLFQTTAAVVMAVAICGMHYIGMAAAAFPADSVCLTADALGGPELTAIITITTGMLLMVTWLTQQLDARLQSTAQELTQSLQASNLQLQRANAALRERAFTDPLTNLPNRLLLEERLKSALARAARANHHGVQERLAAMFVDLDGFKPINDSFGHAMGDQVLLGVAQRLKAQSRASDTVARVGGDEFLLLLEDVHTVDDCMVVAQRVLDALAQPFEVAGKSLRISASIGIAVCPDHADGAHLVARADAAMYAAKRSGGHNLVVYAPHMDIDSSEQMALQSDLHQALELQQLQLVYQPKVNACSGCIAGVEALLRWNHPARGTLSPDVFIPLAERSGLSQPLGHWVIDETCRQLAQWTRQGLYLRAAINVSAQQLRSEGLAAHIGHAIASHGIRADQLLCEITESVVMEDTQASQRTLKALQALGVFISIDDFGTGYSSLSYLRQLPAQQLKIDRSFVRDVTTSPSARAVVQAVIHLAHALGLRVVAEGVETAAQRDILRSMRCDELQGFFFAQPMDAAALLSWANAAVPTCKEASASPAMGLSWGCAPHMRLR
ncbi:MAG: putative bifunctional diguanylate cyclase/phosphodiesterase [Comamonas sp.]